MNSKQMRNEQAQPTLIIDGIGKIPRTQFRLRAEGVVEFRYLIDDGDYPGFDERWYVMSEGERREHLRLGGEIGKWLESLEST